MGSDYLFSLEDSRNARKEIVRKPKAVDITGFFKKSCIATHTGKAPDFSKKSGAFPAFNG